MDPADPQPDLSKLLSASDAAFNAWRHLPVLDRAISLIKFRKRLMSRAEQIVEAMVADIGKPRFDCMGEVFHICQLIGYLRSHAPKLLKPRRAGTWFFAHKSCRVVYEPLGTVGIISPANYPLILSVGPVLQALVAGNSVILKPTERAPRLNRILQQLFAEWNPEPNLVSFLDGGAAEALALARSAIAKLVFIGGQSAAKGLRLAAAERGTPTVMELGGSDAMIVCADADLDRAAAGAVWGSFFNAGQSCIAVERCIVEASVAEPFVQKLREQLARIKIARPPALDSNKVSANGTAKVKLTEPDVGPMYAVEQAKRIRALIDDACAKGATIIAQHSAEPTEPAIVPPTILGNISPDMRITKEEIFGPIMLVETADSREAAIKLANQSEFGLGASVWTSNSEKAAQMADELQAGGVTINDCLTHFAIVNMPFGGVKASGHGRLQGPEGLLEFVAPKSILSHRIGGRELHWFSPKITWQQLLKICRWMYS